MEKTNPESGHGTDPMRNAHPTGNRPEGCRSNAVFGICLHARRLPIRLESVSSELFSKQKISLHPLRL